MQVVSDETPLFVRWHTLNANGFNPVRSRVQPAVIDMYDNIFVKHKMVFCRLMAFSLHALKSTSRLASEQVIHRTVPKEFPYPTGEPHEVYAELKRKILAITDAPIPPIRTQNIILLGMAGTRRFVDIVRAVPARRNVIIGRVGMGPRRLSKNQNIRGETGYEKNYFEAVEALKRRCHVEAFTLNSRYVHPDKHSHAITQRSMLKDYGSQVHLVHAGKYEDEPYMSTLVECDPFTSGMLKTINCTYMADLKLAWIANHWNYRITTVQGSFCVKDCFEEKSYTLDVGNHAISDMLHHDIEPMPHHINVTDRMIVSEVRARHLDKAFRSALRKGISGLRINACAVNPGPANIPKALHKGNPFTYQDIDDMLALHATRDTVQCKLKTLS